MTNFVNIIFVMFGELVRDRRVKQQMKLKELAAGSGIDQTLLSRIEKGKRLPTESQVERLSELLDMDLHQAKVDWMADKVVELVGYKHYAQEVLSVAESRLEYLTSTHKWEVPKLSKELKVLLDQATVLQEKWQVRRPLEGIHLQKLKEFFEVEYTYESNRIEGNTLTLRETAMVIQQGLTIGGKSVKEHFEAINHRDAIHFMESLVTRREPINRRSVLDLHRLVLKGVDDAQAGVYRTVPVRIAGSKVTLPQPFQLEDLMQDFFEFVQINKDRVHPVILAAEVHERLVSIHPFVDGNGRTARLLMNLVLLIHGYPRVNIKGDNESRLAYYDALEQVQMEGDPMPFYRLVAAESIRSLEEHLQWVV